jgi:hypothetical protein
LRRSPALRRGRRPLYRGLCGRLRTGYRTGAIPGRSPADIRNSRRWICRNQPPQCEHPCDVRRSRSCIRSHFRVRLAQALRRSYSASMGLLPRYGCATLGGVVHCPPTAPGPRRGGLAYGNAPGYRWRFLSDAPPPGALGIPGQHVRDLGHIEVVTPRADLGVTDLERAHDGQRCHLLPNRKRVNPLREDHVVAYG